MSLRAFAVLVGLLVFTRSSDAQTMPWGIAVDQKGTVFVADLYHNQGCVWRIEAGVDPKVALRKRCYDVALDAKGSLVGLEPLSLAKSGRIWREGSDQPVATISLPA